MTKNAKNLPKLDKTRIAADTCVIKYNILQIIQKMKKLSFNKIKKTCILNDKKVCFKT